jgi:hypothetical protein
MLFCFRFPENIWTNSHSFRPTSKLFVTARFTQTSLAKKLITHTVCVYFFGSGGTYVNTELYFKLVGEKIYSFAYIYCYKGKVY